MSDDELSYENNTRARALTLPCPVSWCEAQPGEPCWDQYHDVESPVHLPRRQVLPERAAIA